MSNLIRREASRTVAVQEPVGQYLTFLVGTESFAVSILDIKEIIEIASVTRVPLTPDYIYGVINLRGSVVPVIDLSARLSRKRSEVNKRSCIVLVAVEVGDSVQLVGMLVDEVREILEIPPANIQPAPDFGTDIRTDFIQAMARVDDVFIILLAISRVLSLDELSLLSDLAQSQEHLIANAD
ncbi:chemotaxis protein CheW [Methylomonas albis]|uniref:Purine-binding chemotaxis protein CheW n=1 Tax=Methylomonas albis TaxID=1854563 RepID=A0ABR9D1I4_9GAMM|nr:chemotaxis protein CheW [Methylomonas albis]MBD9356982.1 purine-binding chemotaxis protein CheW [Methylomonas albis]